MEFVFTNTPSPATSFFDEGPPTRYILGPSGSRSDFVNTSSIDTREIDPWTQGVELTQQRRYDAGTVKIWSGLPGHALLKSWHGMDRNARLSQPWEDVGLFDPVDYVEAQLATSSSVPLYTFPIISSDNDQQENYAFDGIIEPLTIRPKIAFFSVDVPFESHDVRGSLAGGNADLYHASDLVVSVFQFSTSPGTVPCLDSSDTFGSIQLPGVFITDRIRLAPFVERDADPTPNSLTSGSRPPSDSYVPSGSCAAAAGFVYDSSPGVGTDSVAFGGLAY